MESPSACAMKGMTNAAFGPSQVERKAFSSGSWMRIDRPHSPSPSVPRAARLGVIQMSATARPSRAQAKCHSPLVCRVTLPSSSYQATSSSQLPINGANGRNASTNSARGPSDTINPASTLAAAAPSVICIRATYS